MGYAVKGITRHTFDPSRSITGKYAKAANAWAWELCKAEKITYWSHSKSEGFRLAQTAEEHAAFGSDDWAYLTTFDAAGMLARLRNIDPEGTCIPDVWATECGKTTEKPKKATPAELRKLFAQLSAMDLPDDARALLQAVPA